MPGEPAPAPGTAAADDLRIVSANLHYGGLDPQGSTGSLDATLALVREWGPHVLLLQEVTARTPEAMTPAPRVPVTWVAQEQFAACRADEAETATIAHLTAIAGSLGMIIAAFGPPRTEMFRRMHNAILLSPDLEAVSAGPPVAVAGSSAPAWAEAIARVPGTPHELGLCSVHLPPRSAVLQRIQAEWLASLVAQEGRLTVLGGDWNNIPRTEAPSERDLRGMNPHLRASRMTRDGQLLRPDYTVDDVLRATGLEDAAACLSPARRQPPILAATGPSGIRVDRFYLTRQLIPALRGYRQTPEGGSDHDTIMIILDRRALGAAAPAGYRP